MLVDMRLFTRVTTGLAQTMPLTHSPTAASTMLLGLALSGVLQSCALVQKDDAGSAGSTAQSVSPQDNRIGSPVGARTAEPLQRSVDNSRKPVNSGPAPVGGAKRAATAAGSEGTQPLRSAASVGVDYLIGPSDLLEFAVFGVPEMERTVRVNATGIVSLPLIGAVTLAGLNTSQAEAMIAKKYAKNFLQNPQVSLFVKEFTSQRITIEGAVARPGIYPVTSQLTLLRALALAGGGGSYALLSEVMLFRRGSSLEADTQMFDLEKIRSGDVVDPVINAEDVIVVKRDPKRTALRDSFFGDLLTTLNPFK